MTREKEKRLRWRRWSGERRPTENKHLKRDKCEKDGEREKRRRLMMTEAEKNIRTVMRYSELLCTDFCWMILY
jgi:hypothetical protein